MNPGSTGVHIVRRDAPYESISDAWHHLKQLHKGAAKIFDDLLKEVTAARSKSQQIEQALANAQLVEQKARTIREEADQARAKFTAERDRQEQELRRGLPGFLLKKDAEIDFWKLRDKAEQIGRASCRERV